MLTSTDYPQVEPANELSSPHADALLHGELNKKGKELTPLEGVKCATYVLLSITSDIDCIRLHQMCQLCVIKNWLLLIT